MYLVSTKFCWCSFNLLASMRASNTFLKPAMHSSGFGHIWRGSRKERALTRGYPNGFFSKVFFVALIRNCLRFILNVDTSFALNLAVFTAYPTAWPMSTFSSRAWCFRSLMSVFKRVTIPVDADSTEHFRNLAIAFLRGLWRFFAKDNISGLSTWYSFKNGLNIIAIPRANWSFLV